MHCLIIRFARKGFTNANILSGQTGFEPLGYSTIAQQARSRVDGHP